MADILYTHEKLGRAVQILATHPGPIKDRLIAAFNDGGIPMVSPDALPDEPRRIWQTRVWEPLTRVSDKLRGSAVASLAGISDEDACMIAESIVTVDSMVQTEIESRSR
jgi:hypothetical protein